MYQMVIIVFWKFLIWSTPRHYRCCPRQDQQCLAAERFQVLNQPVFESENSHTIVANDWKANIEMLKKKHMYIISWFSDQTWVIFYIHVWRMLITCRWYSLILNNIGRILTYAVHMFIGFEISQRIFLGPSKKLNNWKINVFNIL